MDKVIIFGIYEFVSFHTCKTLLNKGVEVIGVHIDEFEKSPFLEEKRLEVGRNANFSEHSCSEWKPIREEGTTQTTFLFSLYDLYMSNKETILQTEKMTSPIIQFMEENGSNANIVLILPIQMLKSNQEKTIEAFIKSVKGYSNNIQLVYLPAVYGPWQPSTFLFQKSILSKWIKEEIIMDEREWTGDVLFVEDTVRMILKTIETGNHGDFVLESGMKNYWEKCADFLQIDGKIAYPPKNEPLRADPQIDFISVEKVTPFADSISKQMELIERLYSKGY